MTPVRAVRGGSGVSTRTARHRDGARARDGDAHAHRAAASARTDSARPRTDSAARQARTHHTPPTAHDNPPAAQPRCVLRPVLAARLAQAQRLCRAACAAATPCARASALPLRSGPGLCRADCSSGRRASPHRTAFTVRAPPRPSETHGPDRPDNINVRAPLHVASFEVPPCVPLRASGSRSVVPPATSRGSTVLFGIICTVPVEYVYEASLSLQRRRRCHRLLPCAEKLL